jgi:hypothetical protein
MASLSALLEAYKDSNRPCRDQLVRSVDQLANFLETAPTPLAPVERQLRRFDMSSFFNRFGLCRNIDALLAGLGFYEQPPGMDGVLYLPVSPAQTLSGASTWRNVLIMAAVCSSSGYFLSSESFSSRFLPKFASSPFICAQIPGCKDSISRARKLPPPQASSKTWPLQEVRDHCCRQRSRQPSSLSTRLPSNQPRCLFTIQRRQQLLRL